MAPTIRTRSAICQDACGASMNCPSLRGIGSADRRRSGFSGSEMDRDKLAALRRKYANAKGGEIFDPAFAAVAATVFVDADQRKWPFAGVATLLGAPMAAPDPAGTRGEVGDVDVAVVGGPVDLG